MIDELCDYTRSLASGEASRETWDRYAHLLEGVTALEINEVLERVLSAAPDVREWKDPVAKLIRAASKSLDKQILPSYGDSPLLNELDAENTVILENLDSIKSASIATKENFSQRHLLRDSLQKASLLKSHYEKMQNTLFPLFEQHSPAHACVKLMWALQDEVLESLEEALSLPETENPDYWKRLGSFFVLAGQLVYRERKILYPAAYASIPHGVNSQGASIASMIGTLSQSELQAVFSLLPIDITFIDEEDRVRFYSNPPHRIFPRTPEVIGRLVQNCHPPKSLAMVENILGSFKDGSRDKANFWFRLKERLIYIEYFAVRDSLGKYMGTLEVSQDITAIHALEGEKRLM